MANLREIIPAFFVGPNGEPLSPEQIKKRQAVAASLLEKATDTSPNAGGWASILSKGVMGLSSGLEESRADRAETANTEYDAGLLGSLFSAQAPASATPAYPSSVAAGGSSMSGEALNVSPEIKTGIVQSASALGIDPVDLATAISYETGGTFNPTQAGPTTKWGQHKGFIQFGEPQAQQYGVDWNNPVGSQLGENGAVVKYLRDRGVKPGMGMLDIYSTINAGAPGLYNRSDAAAGGAPGTVADKVREQMGGHRAKAQSLFKAAMEGAPTGVQVAGGSDADMARVAALPAAPNPNPTVAESLVMPAMGAEQRQTAISAGAPQQAPIVDISPEAAVTPLEAPVIPASLPVDAGTPMAQPPAQDITKVPALSAAADVPMVGPTGQPSVASALTAPTPAPAVGSVAEALAIRPQADPNDRMVADAAHTLQPTQEELAGVFPAAPQAPDQSMQLQRVLADPRASPQTKQVALGLLQRQQAVADRQAAAQVENDQWFKRQQYEQNLRSNDPLIQAQTEKARIEAANLQANPRGEETFYGNPVPIQTPEGIQYGQIGSKGSFKPIQLQEGQTFVPPTKQINTETEILTVNQAGEVIARQPIQNRQAAAETAGGAVEGKTEAERRIAAPADVQMGQNALDLLDQIEKHPARESTVGFGSYLSGVRGTPQFEFNNLVEQAKSGAFLTAIQQLRGFGSLSNAEGGAATAAVTRMNVADTKEGFMAALRDYRKIIEQGVDNAKKRIPASDGGATANAPVRRKFNPATGRIE